MGSAMKAPTAFPDTQTTTEAPDCRTTTDRTTTQTTTDGTSKRLHRQRGPALLPEAAKYTERPVSRGYDQPRVPLSASNGRRPICEGHEKSIGWTLAPKEAREEARRGGEARKGRGETTQRMAGRVKIIIIKKKKHTHTLRFAHDTCSRGVLKRYADPA